ncbi:hypothetical protein [Nocardia goodfellowii]|uniref:Transcription-repair coupling factor (Superfamily II helicase) n=1 Tax=Nocardia goodfellowii TaxID=882446 RepID=A0ABS4QPD4_9NOCA|nr:hypothetical protein [Nocardia goodfellowii]MBP2193576.1 transcription-repair coupling factor (superfamily II helicase) [Nocardia goodfellowii]
MSEPCRVLRLVATAITALATGGHPALDNIIRDLNDHDLEALITHMTHGIGAHVQLLTTPDYADRIPPRRAGEA